MNSVKIFQVFGAYIIFVAVPIVLCQYNHELDEQNNRGEHTSPYHEEDHYVAPLYKFGYWVHDPKTHDIKNHWEHRDGDAVKGSYSLMQPDGHLRIVEYTADKHSGFNAHVTYVYKGGQDNYREEDQHDFGSNHLEEQSSAYKQPLNTFYNKQRVEQPHHFKKSTPERAGHYKKQVITNTVEHRPHPTANYNKKQRLQYQPQQSADYRPFEQFPGFHSVNAEASQRLNGFEYFDQEGHSEKPSYYDGPLSIQQQSSEPTEVMVNLPAHLQNSDVFHSEQAQTTESVQQLETPREFSDYANDYNFDGKNQDDVKIQQQPLEVIHIEDVNDALRHQKRQSAEISPETSAPNENGGGQETATLQQQYDDYNY
ncbi:uncharacterized protein LOC126896257 [Daktulosphaira vitifoliae]|uniref:uncharacterized protein LOC126896257 n=1 Tax=Daktulosphaira vitifoliae TaxID=58002 RepID=UPI0021AA1898|nr:uncharacterized protein LOC126896257 [Daktulosphaira vitifoliae]